MDFWAPWCKPCVKPDVTLLGDNKIISECQPSDKTIGFTTLNQITEVMSRPYTGHLIRIRAKGMLPLETTPEHPILTKSSHSKSGTLTSLGNLTWKEARFLREKKMESDGDYLIVPRIKGVLDQSTVDYSSFVKPRDTAMVGAKGIPLTFPINRESAWLMGLYVAEGSGTVNGPQFDLSIAETEIESKLVGIIQNLGYTSRTVMKPEQHRMRVILNSRILGRVFHEWFGRGAPNKRVPDFILYLSDISVVESFLDGYMAGDGSIGYSHAPSYRSAEKTVVSAATVSRTLALQIQLLFARLGILVSICERRNNRTGFIQGRSVQLRNIYVLSYSTHGTQSLVFEDHIATPVRSLEQVEYNGNVFNVETSDNTYLVSNAVVHNCLRMNPLIEKLAERHSAIVFAKVNVDQDSEIASRYHISSLPAYVMFKDAHPAASKIGAVSEIELEKLISEMS